MGTVVNGLAVIGGGLLGVFFKKSISETWKRDLFQLIGILTLFIGILGMIKEALEINQGQIVIQSQMMLILSLMLGFFLGEWTDIDGKLEKLGRKFQQWSKDEDEGFVTGFVSATVLICVGAMAIVGSLEDGLSGDPSTLYAKSVLDFVAVMILSSTLGIGTVFSVIPMVIYQGGITLLSGTVAPYMSPELIGDLSLVGSGLIFCIGINLLFDKKIKVANLLWALVFPILYHFIG
ncbi:MAG: DUF554 domain-containing protein [Tissierellia bacterium]|nr:DUF554 domain-containing protein [Tissierellia bacterium]